MQVYAALDSLIQESLPLHRIVALTTGYLLKPKMRVLRLQAHWLREEGASYKSELITERKSEAIAASKPTVISSPDYSIVAADQKRVRKTLLEIQGDPELLSVLT